MKKVLFLITSIVMLFITGCMGFSDSKLTYKEYKPVKNKPVVEIQAENFIYWQYSATGRQDKNLSNEILGKIIEDWKDKALIKNYGTLKNLKTKPDYVLKLSGSRKDSINPGLAWFSIITIGVIPCDEQYAYDLTLTLIDQKTKKEYINKIKTSYTIWNSIIFLPATPFYWVGRNNMFSDISMYSYSEFKKQGAFDKAKGGI